MTARVLVVDDSAYVRAAVTRALARDGLDVVGVAADGEEAVAKNLDLEPDIVVLDLQMPRMDGVEALRRIRATRPVPVIVFASMDAGGAERAVEALAEGAVDVIPKPLAGALTTELVPRVWAILAGRAQARPPAGTRAGRRGPARVVVVASSTGGPACVERILRALPEDFPAPVVVAQHMPAGFTASFARRLDGLAALRVFEARDGDVVGPGDACILPGGAVGTLTGLEGAALDRFGVRVNPHATLPGARPSASALFFSALGTAGGATAAVVLTGMGADGADAVGSLVAAGGRVIAQDPAEAVIASMPNAAIAAGAQRVETLERIPAAITAACAPRLEGRA